MPAWCPKCGAMLPEGLERCPRCGTALGGSGKGGDEETKNISVFWISLYMIGILMIPLLIGIGFGLICFWLYSAGS